MGFGIFLLCRTLQNKYLGLYVLFNSEGDDANEQFSRLLVSLLNLKL